SFWSFDKCNIVVAMDFDRVHKRLYWIDVSRRVIERMSFNGSNREVVVNGVLHGEGLAIDWIARKLYWVDSFMDCLKVSELDGRFVKKLAEHCVDANNTYCFENPRAIVLYVYWTDWGDKAFIGRVGMDGTKKVAVITTKIEWPNGLTIDYTNDKLYWSDKGNKYDGSGRQVLVNTTHRPFDIHVSRTKQLIHRIICARVDSLLCVSPKIIYSQFSNSVAFNIVNRCAAGLKRDTRYLFAVSHSLWTQLVDYTAMMSH
uniref:Uncharacterized protein n=1 Tax=Hippocampus comes TaxID=109280 RepID=A0A3Q2YC63_HIPCM